MEWVIENLSRHIQELENACLRGVRRQGSAGHEIGIRSRLKTRSVIEGFHPRGESLDRRCL